MLKNFRFAILAALLLANCLTFAQKSWASDSTSVATVGVLLPLHLDSLFKAGSYRYGNSIPKFAISNLEFYNGVQLAADSLRQEGINARIEVVDSRNNAAVRALFMGENKPHVIIGVVQSAAELKLLTDLAASRNIPFVNASYPNDGGLTDKPNLIIVNSTLRTHCTSLYKYLQRNHSTDNLLLLHRNGSADQRLMGYIKEAETNTAAIKLGWRRTVLNDSFEVETLLPYLDSTTTNTLVVASLDDDFGKKVLRTLSSYRPKYKINVFGMPTWDEFPLSRSEYRGIDVFYSTAFITSSGNLNVFRSVSEKFKDIAKSRPSDMVFRGFELSYRFTKTMAAHPDAFNGHLNDGDARVFTDFKFEPVQSKASAGVSTDYYENKRVYFVKKTDGLIKGVY
ncbi:MAG: hypothetical protein EAY75_01105 [Bacteroidetes bacterium]|nr:MAG: hypothetical protein EAY75_01105 [Bacteroidota bacterium]